MAFVAAALGLGICAGMDFVSPSGHPRGPNLLHALWSKPREALPQDIRAECFDGIREDERPRPGDWIAIWGGKKIPSLSGALLTEQDLRQPVVARCSWQNTLDSKSSLLLTSREVVRAC